MTKNLLSVTEAPRNNIVTESKFSGYDHCLNPYVGCEFGCKYCYVRFTVKDKNYAWGEFLRTRNHLADRLPKDLIKIGPTRLVIGTMTDPWQPAELEYRLTRTALQILAVNVPPMIKVGMFTRSPLVVQDLDLIKTLPRARVHFTITPYPRDVLEKIEPIAIQTEARFKAVEKIKAAGIRVHVSVAPVLPILSEPYTEEFAARLAKIGVDEFFVDPMQPYRESLDSIRESMAGHPAWAEVERIITNKPDYQAWKTMYSQAWIQAWRANQHLSPNTLPIMTDHVSHTKIDMRDDSPLDWERYGDDLNG